MSEKPVAEKPSSPASVERLPPPVERPLSPVEIGFNATRDSEADKVRADMLSAVATLGLPPLWRAALAVAAPVAADTAAQIVKALHPESPGGSKLTKGELRAIAKREAARFEAALVDAFEDQIG